MHRAAYQHSGTPHPPCTPAFDPEGNVRPTGQPPTNSFSTEDIPSIVDNIPALQTTPAHATAAAMIILASQSPARRALLTRAGLVFEAMPSPFDEAKTQSSLLSTGPQHLATSLAEGKALAVSHQHPESLVIGADQTLSCEGKILHKPGDWPTARAQLRELRGKTHDLTSAVVCARGGRILWSHSDTASVTFRAFSDSALEDYLSVAGDGILQSVGSYHYEGHGLRLMDHVKGSDHTILGLPVLPLMAFLRQSGYIAP